MESTNIKLSWENYIAGELRNISKILTPLGFSVDEKQLHIGGERYLMTKNKLVVTGNRLSDNKKVVIKASNHPDGQKEIENEKKSRDLLKSLSFAKKAISFPEEILYGKHGDYLIWVISFIPQEKVFVAHSTEEQFFIALRAFETQESFHATTFEHLKKVGDVFPVSNGREYLKEFDKFKNSVNSNCENDDISVTMIRAEEFLKTNKSNIDRYSNHLTHTDFVPHNFRLNNNEVYMLDCSAVQFGNKYEGWARFLNYMTLHSPELEKLLSEYIRKNRGEDDYLSLRLMRVYKLGLLLDYHAKSIKKTEGDLLALTELRLDFWNKAMKAVLDDTPIPGNIISEYKQKRDKLRSEEEKERQREFAIA